MMDETAFQASVHFGDANFAVKYEAVPENSWVRDEATLPKYIRTARWMAQTSARFHPKHGLQPCGPGDTTKGSPIAGYGKTPAEAAQSLTAKLAERAAQFLEYQRQRSN
jgi:hypothetical protein